MTNEIREKRLSYLAKLKRVWGANSTGREDTTPGLIELCRDWIKPEHEIAEIGCFAGVSTSVFACFSKSVLAIDPWTSNLSYKEIDYKLLSEAEYKFQLVCELFPNIKCIKNFSSLAAKNIPDQSLDLVYIDGEHTKSAFILDVTSWRPKIRSGGVIAGHDWGIVENYFNEAGLPQPVKLYSDTSWATLVK